MNKGDKLNNNDDLNPSLYSLNANLSKIVVEYIENKILSGEYKSGDKVNEYFIARELQISRAPIREAVKTLQISGILDFMPRRGSAVASLSRDDINEIFDIRISLERDILQIAKEQGLLNEKNISVLTAKADHMFERVELDPEGTNKIYTLNKLDLDFHTYIWNLAKSPRRASMLRNMFMQLLIAMNKDTTTLGKIEEKSLEHLKLVNVLKNGTLAEIYIESREHINHYRKELYHVELL